MTRAALLRPRGMLAKDRTAKSRDDRSMEGGRRCEVFLTAEASEALEAKKAKARMRTDREAVLAAILAWRP